MNKKDFCGLAYNTLIVFVFSLITLTDKKHNDVLRYIMKCNFLDKLFAGFVVLGFVTIPVLLICSFYGKVKNKENTILNSMLPLILSTILFFLLSINFMFFFSKISLGLLGIPLFFSGIYFISIFVVLKRIK